MSAYVKEFLSIVEIENKICQICFKLKTPVELISDKLIMSLEGLPTSNLPRQIDHPKMYYIDKGHCRFGCHITEIFQGLIFRRCNM